VRNVIAYADADSVRIELTVDDDAARLVISDDGRGFDPAIRERRLTEGHLGLSLVEELARDFGGSLVISSSEGAGTRVELEVPSR
jgi:signal transduction histidine kinase